MSSDNGLFSRFGVELEYILAVRDSLDVAPVADRVLHTAGSARKNERRWNGLRISNELVLHVLELKTDGPAPSLAGLSAVFQEGVRSINARLAAEGVRLLPGAMHPWMDPSRETILWPHGDQVIYQTFDRIFDCRGHGWSNLQSTHLNLPFADEAEFARLHEALRVMLPLVPAFAASSPYLEGRAGGLLDHRLAAYRENCRRIPSITGRVVPERVESIAAYRSGILDRIAGDLAPLDPAGILEPEWVNARGAIARFERGTIEMRVMDVQECPAADLALLQLFVAVLRELTGEEGAGRLRRLALPTDGLADLFEAAVAHGAEAPVQLAGWGEAWGLREGPGRRVRDVMEALVERHAGACEQPGMLRQLLEGGNLATRLLRAGGASPAREHLREIYRELADCLHEGRLFVA